MSFASWGHVAEWLRNGLQNRVHQFNSGRGLQTNPLKTLTICILDLFRFTPGGFLAAGSRNLEGSDRLEQAVSQDRNSFKGEF